MAQSHLSQREPGTGCNNSAWAAAVVALIAIRLGLLPVAGVGLFGIARPEMPVAAAHAGRLDSAGLAEIRQADQLPAASVMRTEDTVVGLTTAPGLIVIRSIDRSAYDAIRHGALALLLIGLLVIGAQLLRALTQRLEVGALIRDRPMLASVSLGTLVIFVLTALSLAISPGMLARLSAGVEVEQVAHACRSLETEHDRPASARTVGNGELIEAAKRRMHRVAEACLGLPYEAAASAIEQIMVRSELVKAEAMPTSFGNPANGSEPDLPAAELIAVNEERSRTDREILSELLASLPPKTKQRPDSLARAGLVADGATAALSGSEPRNLVTRTAVNFRAAPGVESPRLGTLVSGARVNVLRQHSGWAEILLDDDRRVYVASEFLAPAP